MASLSQTQLNSSFPFPHEDLSVIGGWCVSKDQCLAALQRRQIKVEKYRTIPVDELLVVYQDILGRPYNIFHCFTAPTFMKDRCIAYYVFPVTGDVVKTSTVRHTSEGLEIAGLSEPDADTLAKLRKLLGVGPEVDISEFAKRFSAVSVGIQDSECELILSNLALDLGVARKDVVFRLFQDPSEMATWVSDYRALTGDLTHEYHAEEGAEDGEPPAEDGEPPAEDGEPPAEDGKPPAEDGEPPAEV